MAQGIDPELKLAIIELMDERLRRLEVRRSDLQSLHASLKLLAEAQAKTERRMAELAEAQARTDRSLEKLAQAQAGTDERVGRLEESMAELAQAQARTEAAVEQLAKQIGHLSDAIGYGLEDIARVVAPGFLLRHHGIEMEEFVRRFLPANGREVEVDLYVEGRKDGRELVVVGEVKSRIHGREVLKFARVVKALRKSLKAQLFPLMFAYWIHPSASAEAEKHGIQLIASYQR